MPNHLIFAMLAFAAPLLSQTADVLASIRKSADDWNTGSLEAYVSCYEKSAATTFVGATVSHGSDAVLERYRRAYPNRQSMGHLSFSELEPRLLKPDIAIVTGRYTLARAAGDGGAKTGLFTVVLRKSKQGWRIVHDHSN